MMQPIYKNKEASTKERLEEAMLILEAETNRSVEEIRQRMEFICASLRAQGNTQINKMLMAVRELTVEEYCDKYGADTQHFLDQQTARRLGTTSKKRPLQNENENSDSAIKRRRKSISISEEGDKAPAPTTNHQDFVPLFVHIERENHPKINIRLDPEHTIDKLGKLKMDALNAILTQLNDTQRSNVRDQIQDLQDQLESLKKILS